MKIESKAAEGKINPNVVTVIVAALLLFALAGGIYYFNSPEARANGLIEKAGTGIDEADYDNAITDLKGAYELDPENAEANAIINSYLKLILDKAEETQTPEKKKWIASFVCSFESDDPIYSRTLERADELYEEAERKIASAPYATKAEALFDKGDYDGAAKEYDNAIAAGAIHADISPKYDLNCVYLKLRELAEAPDRTGIIDYMNSVSFNCVKDLLNEKSTIDISDERYLVISKRKDDYVIIYGSLDSKRDGSAAGMISQENSNAIYEGEWVKGLPEGYGRVIRWDKDKEINDSEMISGKLEKGYFTGNITYCAPDVPSAVLSPEIKEPDEDDPDGEAEEIHAAGVPVFADDANVRDLHKEALESLSAEEEDDKKKSKKKKDDENNDVIDYPSMDVFDATVWPIQDTPFEFDGKDLKAGTLAGGTPAKIVAEKDDMFYVRVGDKKGFVDKSACMINLPDVMQKDMQYEITNSDGSIYKINEKRIDGVTGEPFYPYVNRGDGRYLVPLIFPAAKALYNAEDYILGRGYTFKIYDAYQPNPVSKTVYSDTSDFLKENEELSEFLKEGGHKLKDFLPEGESDHNYGTALDITFVKTETKEEADMQSPMHELSQLSLTELNTPDADMMKGWMEEYGFSGSENEWWHFDMKDKRIKCGVFQVAPYSEIIPRQGN